MLIKFLGDNKLFIIGALLIGAIVALGCRCKSLSEEADRLSNNQLSLLTDIETYKTESGKNAAKVIQLEMRNSEFKELCSEQAAIIKDMGLEIKRLEYVSSTGSVTHYRDTAYLSDTVFTILHDTVMTSEKGKHFEMSDGWNHISGSIIGDKVECDYTGTDTLTVAAVKVPKRFLFFKWGCKYVSVNVSHRNPKTSITYNNTVKLK